MFAARIFHHDLKPFFLRLLEMKNNHIEKFLIFFFFQKKPHNVNAVVKCNVVLYREEVVELAVKELLQLALVELVLVPIVPRVVVEHRHQRVHRTLELSRHSAERTGTPRQRFRLEITKNRVQGWEERCSYLVGVAGKCGKAPRCRLFISD